MKRASDLFDEDQRRRINEAVAAAERRTAAEIVPAIATASGRYDRAEDLVGLWVGLVAMIVVWFVFRAAPPSGDWAAGWRWTAGVWPLVAAVLIGFVAGAGLASFCPVLRRLFIPRRELAAEVKRMARQVFFDSRLSRTTGRTGLLIFVSLYERRVVVLADEAVSDALGESDLQAIRDDVLGGLRSKQACEGLCAAIARAGELLESRLPIQADDTDELANELVVLD